MAATVAAAAQRSVARPRTSLVRAFAENVECLAIAVVMALVLKYFLIEAYKIPTGSMQPTIMGDNELKVFDRVLVNKLVYFLRKPERFEVIVFKNPLWQRQNYIKRLIGFSKERIALRNGDVYVTEPGESEEHVARKSDGAWASVRKSVLPQPDGKVDLRHDFEPLASSAVVGDAAISLRATPDAPASVVTRRPIKDRYLDGYDPRIVAAYRDLGHVPNEIATHNVPDVEIECDARPGKGARALVLTIEESGRKHRATLPCGAPAAGSPLERGEGTSPDGWAAKEALSDVARAVLPAERATRVAFRNVDDQLVLSVDGRVVAREPYVTRGLDPDTPTRVTLTAEGGPIELANVALYRDLYYLPDGNPTGEREAIYTVPEGHYFALGDNTQNSWDCRQWQKARFKLKDGRVLEGNNFYSGAFNSNPDANPSYESKKVDGRIETIVHFRNLYGQDLTFPRDEVANPGLEPDVEPVHSFPHEFLLGKALAVFWPLPPFSPSWRLKWVR